MCFVNVSGVSVIGGVVIHRSVRAVVVFDVPVVVLNGALFGVVFVSLLGVFGVGRRSR